MFKLSSPLAIAGALLSLSCLGAAPAQATLKSTFISGKGTDSGTCALANPCRTFQFAIDQTNPGGVVKVLDVANYGAMAITKSISITGIEGAGIDSLGDAIDINAGANDTINLSYLIIDGLRAAVDGVRFNSGGSLTITHCTVRNYISVAIDLHPNGITTFLIADTLVSDNLGAGAAVSVFPNGGSAQGSLDHVLMNKNNGGGISVDSSFTSGAVNVTAVDSMATNNKGVGFEATGSPTAVLRLARSVATGNGAGVSLGFGAKGESAGDNFIRGNVTNINDPNHTLTNVGTQRKTFAV